MFIIYTDGAYSSKRNQGGWAFLILHNDTVQISKFGGVKCNATNNRMELLAVINAVKLINKSKIIDPVTVYSDSQYVLKTISKEYTIKCNDDLWKEFFSLDISNITFQYVKAHYTNKYNNICDQLAVLGTNLILNE